jgi:hypothetical protein
MGEAALQRAVDEEPDGWCGSRHQHQHRSGPGPGMIALAQNSPASDILCLMFLLASAFRRLASPAEGTLPRDGGRRRAGSGSGPLRNRDRGTP